MHRVAAAQLERRHPEGLLRREAHAIGRARVIIVLPRLQTGQLGAVDDARPAAPRAEALRGGADENPLIGRSVSGAVPDLRGVQEQAEEYTKMQRRNEGQRDAEVGAALAAELGNAPVH